MKFEDVQVDLQVEAYFLCCSSTSVLFVVHFTHLNSNVFSKPTTQSSNSNSIPTQEPLINTISNLNKAVDTQPIPSSSNINAKFNMNQLGNPVNPSQMPQATPSVLKIPLRMKKKRMDWQLTESTKINTTESIPRTQSSLARFKDIQHFAGGVHLPSAINFQTGGFKKSFRPELNALKSQFKILKVGLQLTEHPNFEQQDLATIRQNFQDIFLTQFHYLNNRKKELYILQSTNEEVAQVFKSLGHEGHLEGADQLRLAQAIAFYNESQKLENHLVEVNNNSEEVAEDLTTNHSTINSTAPEDNTAHWQIESQVEDT